MMTYVVMILLPNIGKKLLFVHRLTFTGLLVRWMVWPDHVIFLQMARTLEPKWGKGSLSHRFIEPQVQRALMWSATY